MTVRPFWIGEMGRRPLLSGGDPYTELGFELKVVSIVGIMSYCDFCWEKYSSCTGYWKLLFPMVACIESREPPAAGWGMLLTRLKWPLPPGLWRLTTWPLGKMWARAHLGPNLQLPLRRSQYMLIFCAWHHKTYLGEVFAGRSFRERFI